MKIRKGFVSNSSSSSFVVWGASISKDDTNATEEDKEDFTEFLWNKDFECESDDYSKYYVGLSPEAMGADQTLNEFKLEICAKFKEVGIDMPIDKLQFINEVTYD